LVHLNEQQFNKSNGKVMLSLCLTKYPALKYPVLKLALFHEDYGEWRCSSTNSWPRH